MPLIRTLSAGCRCSAPGSCCGGDAGAPCRAMEKTATEERAEMQELNDRLASYVSRVRQMRGQVAATPGGYHEAMKGLEDEILKVKALYEAELNRLRLLLDGANKQTASMMTKMDQFNINSAQGQARISEESTRARTNAEDLQSARALLAQMQKELTDMRMALQERDNELRDVRPRSERLQRENEELKRRLECEMDQRLHVSEELKLNREKTNFDGQARDQAVRDLEERLRASNNIVINLETKINQLTRTESFDINSVLKKLREGSAAELQRYQKETEEALSRSLCTLQAQIEEEAKAKGMLGAEKGQLENQNLQLQAMLADLEAKLNAALQQRSAAEDALNAEKTRGQAAISDLERRLRQLQESMMAKVKECTGARDAQMSLKMEIDAYRTLVEAEERQLSTPTQQDPVTNFRESYRMYTSNLKPPMTTPLQDRSNSQYTNTVSFNYPLQFGDSKALNRMTTYSSTYKTASQPPTRISANFTPFRPGSCRIGRYNNLRATMW